MAEDGEKRSIWKWLAWNVWVVPVYASMFCLFLAWLAPAYSQASATLTIIGCGLAIGPMLGFLRWLYKRAYYQDVETIRYLPQVHHLLLGFAWLLFVGVLYIGGALDPMTALPHEHAPAPGMARYRVRNIAENLRAEWYNNNRNLYEAEVTHLERKWRLYGFTFEIEVLARDSALIWVYDDKDHLWLYYVESMQEYEPRWASPSKFRAD